MEVEDFYNQIIEKEFVSVRCYSASSEIKRFDDCYDPKVLTVLKFCDNKTGKHLFSISGFQFSDDTASQNDSSKVLYFIKVIVKLKKNYVYVYSWEDVNNGICSKENLGEVLKDKDGIPEITNLMYVYISANLYFGMSGEELWHEFEIDVMEQCEKKYKEHYVPVDSPNIDYRIKYKNDYKERKRAEYLQKKEQERNAEYEKKEQLMSDLYAGYEEHKYDKDDMDYEQKIMDALENGDPEIYGF